MLGRFRMRVGGGTGDVPVSKRASGPYRDDSGRLTSICTSLEYALREFFGGSVSVTSLPTRRVVRVEIDTERDGWHMTAWRKFDAAEVLLSRENPGHLMQRIADALGPMRRSTSRLYGADVATCLSPMRAGDRVCTPLSYDER